MNSRHDYLARMLRISCSSFAYVCLTLNSAFAQTETITFDEVVTQPVDDLAVEGVTFDFKVGGVDSADATFNAPGFAGQNFTDLQVLEGDANGILTIDFDKPVATFQFGATLNSTALAATPGLTVDLFGTNLAPLGTIPLALSSVGVVYLEGQFIYPGGPPVSRARIDFVEASAGVPARFQIDNLSYVLYVPPVVIAPEKPAAVVPPGQPRRVPPPVAPPFLIVDLEAIAAATSSGLAMPSALQGILQSVNQPALRDINSRLFRARTQRPVINSDTMAGGSLTRYMDFAARQNIDARVALGMREGRAVQVEVYDTLQVSHPFAMQGGYIPIATGVATTYVTAAPEGEVANAKNPHPAANAEPAARRWQVFSSFDYGNDDLEELSSTFRGYQSHTYSGTAGAEYLINDWLATGIAFTHLENQSELAGDLGSIDIEGQLYTAYVTAFNKGYYADLLVSYGNYDNHLSRNPRFGNNATADPESDSQTYALNLGKNFALTDHVKTGPVLATEYNRGKIDRYTERGNQRANLIYSGAGYDSLITRLGWHLSHSTTLQRTGIHSQIRLAWEREHQPQDDQVSASLEQSPFLLVTPGVGSERIGGFSTSKDQSHAGTDWLALGGGIRFEFSNRVDLLLDYEARLFQNNKLTHFASLKLSYEF